MIKVYDLVPHTGQKSFYGKARIVEDGDVKKLFSYETHVATIENGKLTILGHYSATTWRHIRSFAYLNGFELASNEKMFKMYSKGDN